MKVQLLRISFVRKVGIGDAVCNFSLVQTAKRLLRCSALLLYYSFITLKQPEYSRQITMCSSPRLSPLTKSFVRFLGESTARQFAYGFI